MSVSEGEEPSRQERAIGRRAAEARATVPDLELSGEADISAWMERGGGPVTALLIAATARALKELPRANSAYRDGRFESHDRINIGVPIETDDAYVLATIFDADERSIEEIAGLVKALRERGSAGELTPPELSGATFVVSDLGEYGVGRASAILTPPHAAALAAGAVRAVPVVRGEDIVPGYTMILTLISDHRILFAADAARFLARVTELLEEASRG